MKTLDNGAIVYELMAGLHDIDTDPVWESQFVENEFANGKFCDKAYEEIFRANQRLCEKLGVEEDTDVECIINCFLEMTEYLCQRMYEYGARFAQIDMPE